MEIYTHGKGRTRSSFIYNFVFLFSFLMIANDDDDDDDNVGANDVDGESKSDGQYQHGNGMQHVKLIMTTCLLTKTPETQRNNQIKYCKSFSPIPFSIIWYFFSRFAYLLNIHWNNCICHRNYIFVTIMIVILIHLCLIALIMNNYYGFTCNLPIQSLNVEQLFPSKGSFVVNIVQKNHITAARTSN